MVGRKLSSEELQMTPAASSDQQHQISNTLYHESNERFSEGTLKQEGTVKNVARNFYAPLLLFVGVALAYRVYQEQYRALPLYEDYLDWLVF